MNKAEQIKEELEGANEDALYCTDLEDALIGICYRFGQPPLAAYSKSKIIDIYVNRDGMTYEEAVEFFEYNVLGAWVGDNTPVFIEEGAAV